MWVFITFLPYVTLKKTYRSSYLLLLWSSVATTYLFSQKSGRFLATI